MLHSIIFFLFITLRGFLCAASLSSLYTATVQVAGQSEYTASLIECSDGGIILVLAVLESGKYNMKVLKLSDDPRQLEWGILFNHGTHEIFPFSIIETYDGNYLISGAYKNTGLKTEYQTFLMKIESTTQGSVKWSTSYAYTGYEQEYAFVVEDDQSIDRFLYVAFRVNNAGSIYTVIMKLDESGQFVWAKKLGSHAANSKFNLFDFTICTNCLAKIEDAPTANGFLVSMTKPNSYNDLSICLLDGDGTIRWWKIYSQSITYHSSKFSIHSNKSMSKNYFYVVGSFTDNSLEFLKIMKLSASSGTILRSFAIDSPSIYSNNNQNTGPILYESKNGDFLVLAFLNSAKQRRQLVTLDIDLNVVSKNYYLEIEKGDIYGIGSSRNSYDDKMYIYGSENYGCQSNNCVAFFSRLRSDSVLRYNNVSSEDCVIQLEETEQEDAISTDSFGTTMSSDLGGYDEDLSAIDFQFNTDFEIVAYTSAQGSISIVQQCDERCYFYDDPEYAVDGEIANGLICSGNGNCVSRDYCSCNDGYIGINCNITTGTSDIDDDNNNNNNDGGGNSDDGDGLTGLWVSLGVLGGAGLGLPLICCVFICCFVVVVIIFVLLLLFLLVVCCCMIFFVFSGCFSCFYFLQKVIMENKSSVMLSDSHEDIDKFDRIINKEMSENDPLANINIDKSLFEIKYQNLKVLKTLGSGGSNSVVFHCTWKDSTDVAFKCFKTQDLFTKQSDFSVFEKEVEIMSSIRHPNCLSFYGCCLHPPRVGIVMEYCKNGDLKDFLEEKGKNLNLSERIRILRECCDALSYLHDRNVIHRDMKSENVLITDHHVAKIIDFGLSKICQRMSKKKTKNVGTSYYMAPEVTLGHDYDSKCDVFSFSIVCWEVLSNNFEPYGRKGAEKFNLEYCVANDSNMRPDIQNLLSRGNNAPEYLRNDNSNSVSTNNREKIIKILERSWDRDPSVRPTFEDLTKEFTMLEK